MKNKFIIPVFAVLVAGLAYGTSIYAQDQTSGSSTIIQKLVQRFGLNQSDVQAVFDEERDEHIKNMQARIAENLTQAVTDGKITETQKQLIIAKKAELMTKHLENKENWQNDKQELDSWASQNGIDLQYLHGGVMGGFGMKHVWFNK